MRALYLVRGLPGSGKTTLVNTLTAGMSGWIVRAADQYFEDENGYHFDASKLPLAHKACFENVKTDMDRWTKNIFVTNTFTEYWEMAPYIKLAEENGYQVFTFVVENRHGNANVHSVPDQTVEKMRNRFDISL